MITKIIWHTSSEDFSTRKADDDTTYSPRNAQTG